MFSVITACSWISGTSERPWRPQNICSDTQTMRTTRSDLLRSDFTKSREVVQQLEPASVNLYSHHRTSLRKMFPIHFYLLVQLNTGLEISELLGQVLWLSRLYRSTLPRNAECARVRCAWTRRYSTSFLQASALWRVGSQGQQWGYTGIYYVHK